jgi:hypothetical protein
MPIKQVAELPKLHCMSLMFLPSFGCLPCCPSSLSPCSCILHFFHVPKVTLFLAGACSFSLSVPSQELSTHLRCMHACECMCACACVCACMCVCVCVCVCMYVCVCEYMRVRQVRVHMHMRLKHTQCVPV